MTRRTWILAPLLLVVGFALGGFFLHQRGAEESTRLAMADGGWRGLFQSEYNFTDLRVVSAAIVKVQDKYLDPRRPDPELMLEKALQSVEQMVPEVLFQELPDQSRLRIVVGSQERTVPIARMDRLGQLGGVLRVVAKELDALLPEDVDRRELEYVMTNGLLAPLDPHSVLITPDQFEEMQTESAGSFGGLGISIQIIDRRLTVTCPMPDTPAASVGLQSGDVITRIGQVSTTNMPIDEAVRRLRGPVGEPVTVSVSREDQATFEATVIRDVISLPHLEQLYLGDGIGYVRLRKFYRTAYGDLQLAINALAEQAGRPLEGLVLDLRNNPGGLLNQAEEIADLFLADGDIVSVVGADDRRPEVTQARRSGTRADLRLALLINSETASASEIVAGAIRAHDRGLVLGVRSFGKGSVQNLWPLNDSSALKLTTAEYLTAGQISIQSLGILPDVELRPGWVSEEEVYLHYHDAAYREEDLDEALESRFARPGAPPTMVVHYLEPKLSPDAPHRDRFDCRGVAEMVEDFQVQIARTVLVNSDTPTRSAMLEESKGALEVFLAGRERELHEKIEDLGIDWSGDPSEVELDGVGLNLEVEVSESEGHLQAGDQQVLRFHLRNEGAVRVPRVRALIDSELRFLKGRELLFGAIEPGAAAVAELSVKVPPDIYSLVEESTVAVYSGDRGPLAELPVRVEVRELPLPRFAINVALVDDGSGQSRGNGDGLLAPGEAMDVAVTVKNVGEAPTGDRWVEEWWHRSNDDRPDRQRLSREGACWVKVLETSGESLFFPDGEGGGSCSGWSDEMSFADPLMPGESRHLRFHFEAGPSLLVEQPNGEHVAASDESPVRLRVLVNDQALWETADQELELPLPPEDIEVRSVDREMQTRGAVTARSAAHPSATVLAELDGPVQVDARVGEYWRVRLPWGVPGFVLDDDLKSGRGKGTLRADEVLAQRPPIILLDRMPELVSTAERLRLSGRVTDDGEVRHLLAFVNGRKVRVLTPDAAGSSSGSNLEFDLQIDLKPGVNEVELVAQDDRDGSSSRHLAVFRDAPGRAAERGQ
jgi:carboxyl-terminal processing protease